MKWVIYFMLCASCLAGSTNWLAQRTGLVSDYGNCFDDDQVSLDQIPGLKLWLPFPAPFVGTQYCFAVSCTNDFTISGATWTNTMGGAMSFNGVSDRLSRSSLSLNGAEGATFMFWAYPKTGGPDIGWRLIDNRTSNGYIAFINTTNSITPRNISLLIDTASGDYRQENTGNNVIDFDKWTRIVLRYYGTYISIFTNGVVIPSTPASSGTGNVVDDGNTCYIGDNAAGNRSFYGYLDDVRVYNYAVATENIVADFEQTKSKYGL